MKRMVQIEAYDAYARYLCVRENDVHVDRLSGVGIEDPHGLPIGGVVLRELCDERFQERLEVMDVWREPCCQLQGPHEAPHLRRWVSAVSTQAYV